MAKHTPGPWKVSPVHSGRDFGAIVADQRPVDRPSNPYEDKETEELGGHLIAESVTRSNRPVISAAPDLYDALANTLCRICDVYIGDPPKPDMNPCTECAKARSALAKARGGADDEG